MKPFRVLALDGGGMRGLYSATVLDCFAKHFAAARNVKSLDVGKGFDLIAGTSTGGLVACGLAHGLSPREMIDLFREVGPLLFRRPVPASRMGLLRWVVGTLRSAANSDESLRTALDTRFGSTTLEELFLRRGIALCIPCVNVLTGRSWVFKTPHSADLTRDKRFKISDVCLSTSAAPIYLPLAAVDDPEDGRHQLILADGGLWANNPVLIGLIEALGLAAPDQPIHVLSVSTCPPQQGEMASRGARHWGLLSWKAGTAALNMALESQSWGYHFMAFRLAEVLSEQGRECHVIRVPHSSPAPAQAPHIALDNASDIALQILAELGRLDGDVEGQKSRWAPNLAKMVRDMFFDMPLLSRTHEHGERRRFPRTPEEIHLGGGLIQKDHSLFGACLMIVGNAPTPGDTFQYPAPSGEQRGIVKWAKQLHPGMGLFGMHIDVVPKQEVAATASILA
jgi:uncharacterized protein